MCSPKFVTCELEASQNPLLLLLTWDQKYRVWCHQPLISIDLRMTRCTACWITSGCIFPINSAGFSYTSSWFTSHTEGFNLGHWLCIMKFSLLLFQCIYFLASLQATWKVQRVKSKTPKGGIMGAWISVSHGCQWSMQQVSSNMVLLVEFLFSFHYQLLAVHPLSP